MLEDRYGLALGTDSGQARDAYVRGVDCLLAAQPGAGAAFAEAVVADPEFALALAGSARVAQMNNRMDEAREAATQAARCAASGDDRIRAHVAIFDHLVHGRGEAARQATVAHMARWPRDAVALSPTVGWWLFVCTLCLFATIFAQGDRWRRFWLTMEDPRTIGLFRILFAFFVICDMNDFWEYFRMLFTSEGDSAAPFIYNVF